MSTPETTVAPAFTDPRNIIVGNARVVWVKANGFLSEGWALPGGGRTTNEAEARRVAMAMHQLMG